MIGQQMNTPTVETTDADLGRPAACSSVFAWMGYCCNRIFDVQTTLDVTFDFSKLQHLCAALFLIAPQRVRHLMLY